MSETTVFKNPFRGRTVAKRKPYQPEHERLNVTPIEYPIDKEEVNAFLAQKGSK